MKLSSVTGSLPKQLAERTYAKCEPESLMGATSFSCTHPRSWQSTHTPKMSAWNAVPSAGFPCTCMWCSWLISIWYRCPYGFPTFLASRLLLAQLGSVSYLKGAILARCMQVYPLRCSTTPSHGDASHYSPHAASPTPHAALFQPPFGGRAPSMSAWEGSSRALLTYARAMGSCSTLAPARPGSVDSSIRKPSMLP